MTSDPAGNRSRGLHPTARSIVEQIAAAGDQALPDITVDNVEAIRAVMRAINDASAGTGPALGRVDDVVIAGPGGDLPLRIYAPDRSAPRPVVLWFHGGGFFAGSIDEHDTTCRLLAARADAVVVAVGYRLAPEHRHPAAADDCHAALRWVAAHASGFGGDPDRLAIAGDSAGGTLAATVARRARDEGPALRYQVLVYPVLDPGDGDPERGRGEFHMLRPGDGRRALELYAGPGDADSPDVTPLRAPDLAGLPPALIITAEFDALRLDGEAYAARLREAGVPVTLSMYDGLLHGFYTSAGTFEAEAHAAIDETAAALRTAFADHGAGVTSPRR